MKEQKKIVEVNLQPFVVRLEQAIKEGFKVLPETVSKGVVKGFRVTLEKEGEAEVKAPAKKTRAKKAPAKKAEEAPEAPAEEGKTE